jgi:DNA-binding HxlR family transcriptional regulator
LEPRNSHETRDCTAVTDILSRIGDKWTVQVIRSLRFGKKRFSEIKRDVEGISQRMLTLTLKGLERDGFLTRTVFPTVPPRVDYQLTELGVTLTGPLGVIGDWAVTNRQQVMNARAAYDRSRIEDGEPIYLKAAE